MFTASDFIICGTGGLPVFSSKDMGGPPMPRRF